MSCIGRKYKKLNNKVCEYDMILIKAQTPVIYPGNHTLGLKAYESNETCSHSVVSTGV